MAERHHYPRSPFLLIPHRQEDDDPSICYFYSLNSNNRIRSIHLPELNGLRCFGFSNGWLVVADRFAELHVLNIFTGARLLLPSITTFENINGVITYPNGRIAYSWQPLSSLERVITPSSKMVDVYYDKVIILSSLNPTKITVVIARDDFCHLAYARPGDKCWMKIPASYYVGDGRNTDDVMFHKGKLYGSLCGGTVFEIADIASKTPPRCIPRAPLICKPIRPQANLTVSRCYLVESADGKDLLLVWRHSITKNIGIGMVDNFSLSTFSVFKLDLGSEWIPVTNLGETAIFLGEGRAMALSTCDLPEVKANCIYFTELKSVYLNWEDEACRDEGIFHLDDGSISPFFDRFDRIRFRFPLKIWVTMPRYA